MRSDVILSIRAIRSDSDMSNMMLVLVRQGGSPKQRVQKVDPTTEVLPSGHGLHGGPPSVL